MTLNTAYRQRDRDKMIDFLFDNKFKIIIKENEQENRNKLTLIFDEEDVSDQYIQIIDFEISASSYLTQFYFATNIEAGKKMLKDFETEDDIEEKEYYSFSLCITVGDFIQKYIDLEIEKANSIKDEKEKEVLLEKLNKINKIKDFYIND